MFDIQELIVTAPPFLFALTVHEVAHGYLAYRFGDPTAARLGRLTMNPLKHLDLMGTICFFLIKIGWAKPVPVDPRYFKNPRRDLLLVSLAGPASNLLLALLSGLLLRLFPLFLPVLPASLFWPLARMVAASVWINLLLAVFNMLPIPPLDGSKVLLGLLPPGPAALFARLEPYGFFILLALFYLGIIPRIIRPVINFAQGLIG